MRVLLDECVPKRLRAELCALGLGAELLHEVRRVAALLCELPDIGELLDEHHRRFPLKRFPFAQMYRVEGSRLLILAISHRRHG
jgi:hypothetical protein